MYCRLTSLLLLLYLLPVSSSSRPQWILTRVPVVVPGRTEDLPAPLFVSSAHLNVSSSCGASRHPQTPPSSGESLSRLLSYETLHADGRLTQTAVGVYGSAPASAYSSAYSTSRRVRRKRQIFGHDGRFSIAGRSFLLKFPFSVAVKLSTGCSGTLVGERHVLTAAHCVHDGKNYVKGAQRLRVGFLRPRQRPGRPANLTNGLEGGGADEAPPTNDKMRFQWIRARRTHVPKGWIRGSANDIGMDFDYALLELKKPHRRRHMALGVSPPAARLPGQRLHFSGFDSDRPGRLVYRFCRAGEETPDLLYQRCDARPGASGSGIYARLWDGRRRRWQRKVIGVFSGHQWLERNGATQDFNVAVRITALKYAQICYWITGNYRDCREG